MHLCLTSKREVSCRNHTDYQTMISRIAQAAIYNDTHVLAYAVMSNHAHIIVQTDREERFIRTIKSSYTLSFNHKYNRQGRLFDPGFFKLDLKGISHQQDAITYVLQNPWHHNITENPFDYPYSSMHLYYKEHLDSRSISDIRINKRLLNRNVKLDASLEYGIDGNILPESFVETQMVENIFGSYNAFLYLTHRRNYKEWRERQKQENKVRKENTPEVNFKFVEPLLTRREINDIENNPRNWRKRSHLTDMEICKIIDSTILHRYKCQSHARLNAKKQDRGVVHTTLPIHLPDIRRTDQTVPGNMKRSRFHAKSHRKRTERAGRNGETSNFEGGNAVSVQEMTRNARKEQAREHQHGFCKETWIC